MWTNVYKRVALIVTAAFVLLGAYSMYLALQVGLFSGNTFLPKIDENRYWADDAQFIKVNRQSGGAEFAYATGGGVRYALMRLADGDVTFEYGEGETWNGRVRAGALTDAQGNPVQEETAFITLTLGDEWEPLFEDTVPYLLYRAYAGQAEPRALWWRVIPAAVLFAAGLALWLFPEALGLYAVRWRYRGHIEMSEEGIFAQRAAAAVVMAASAVMLFI